MGRGFRPSHRSTIPNHLPLPPSKGHLPLPNQCPPDCRHKGDPQAAASLRLFPASPALLQAPVNQLPHRLAQRDPSSSCVLDQALGHLFRNFGIGQHRAVAHPIRPMLGTDPGPERLADVGMGGHQGSQCTAGREPLLASESGMRPPWPGQCEPWAAGAGPAAWVGWRRGYEPRAISCKTLLLLFLNLLCGA